MRILLLLIFALIVTIPSALGLVLSEDGTGLKHTFIVQTGGYDFPVVTTGNLDITNLSFDKDTKTITIDISSSLDDNVLEILIPKNLINGDFTFFLDGSEVFPSVAWLTDNAFITIKFQGEGEHTLDIIGTTYLPEFAEVAPQEIPLTHQGKNLINGDFTFFLDGSEVFPSVAWLTDNAFITIKFQGEGEHTLDIIGTTYLPEFAEVAPIVLATSLIGIIVILKRYKKLSY